MNRVPRTLVLHIGWPKTGTTSLQEFFLANRDIMLGQAGVFYPLTGLLGWCHQELSATLKPSSGAPSPLWRKLAAELEREQRARFVLISCEGLQGAEPERAGRMIRELPAFDRTIVVAYVRQPDEIRESQFGQDVKDGKAAGTFADYLREKEDKGKWDYASRIGNWRRLLPDGRFIVRPFERGQWHRGSLLADFCHCLSLPDLESLPGVEPVKMGNPGLATDMLSLSRELNRALTDRRRPGPAQGFAALHFALDRHGLRQELDDRKLSLYSRTQRRELRERVAPVFEELGVRFTESPRGEEDGMTDLPEFRDLSPERQNELMSLTLKGAVLALDDLQQVYWHHQRLVADAKRFKALREEHRRLKKEHKILKRGHEELKRQFGKTLRSRLLAFRAWWRGVRNRRTP